MTEGVEGEEDQILVFHQPISISLKTSLFWVSVWVYAPHNPLPQGKEKQSTAPLLNAHPLFYHESLPNPPPDPTSHSPSVTTASLMTDSHMVQMYLSSSSPRHSGENATKLSVSLLCSA